MSKRSKPPSKIGLKHGDEDDEVGLLQNYLKKYGYIRPEKEAPFGLQIDMSRAKEQPKTNVVDTPTEEALKLFQQFYKLPVTGVLDEATVKLMNTPRCGMPDIVVPAGEIVDYVDSGSKWSKNDLTYRFENYTADLDQNVTERAIQDALREWSCNSKINFSEVSSGGDVRLLWGAGAHDDPNCSNDPNLYFDGPGNVLAHAYYPEDGRVHFDEDENWTDDDPPLGIDLQTVALHELGHTLGLAHSNDPNAVMFAFYDGRRRELQSDDITGIQSIYGSASWWKCRQLITAVIFVLLIASAAWYWYYYMGRVLFAATMVAQSILSSSNLSAFLNHFLTSESYRFISLFLY